MTRIAAFAVLALAACGGQEHGTLKLECSRMPSCDHHCDPQVNGVAHALLDGEGQTLEVEPGDYTIAGTTSWNCGAGLQSAGIGPFVVTVKAGTTHRVGF